MCYSIETFLTYLGGERVVEFNLVENGSTGKTHICAFYLSREAFEWMMEQYEKGNENSQCKE